MDRKRTIKKELKLFKENLSKKIPVKTLLFFGSRARGQGKKYSDVDLIVVSDKFKRKKFHQRAVDLYDYWTLNYPVDFICYTQDEFNKSKRLSVLVKEAIKEGIII
ncbi:nucleotidyltransferase domain-containing protein [Candidatus Woesearchaeota archaeon]|nr:nucleotidyltransferase domain-containing protein [Candidatus Woesearchaeota archaeon]